jgi:hypothetical protein
LHGPRVPAAIILLSRWLHFVGFALVVGSALAVTIARHKARKSTGSERAILESLIADVITKVELPGLTIALLAGLLTLSANPAAVDAKIAGPWFIIKMPLVLALFATTFLRMVGATRIRRERELGAKDAELEPIAARGAILDKTSVALGIIIIFITTFRYVFAAA